MKQRERERERIHDSMKQRHFFLLIEKKTNVPCKTLEKATKNLRTGSLP